MAEKQQQQQPRMSREEAERLGAAADTVRFQIGQGLETFAKFIENRVSLAPHHRMVSLATDNPRELAELGAWYSNGEGSMQIGKIDSPPYLCTVREFYQYDDLLYYVFDRLQEWGCEVPKIGPRIQQQSALVAMDESLIRVVIDEGEPRAGHLDYKLSVSDELAEWFNLGTNTDVASITRLQRAYTRDDLVSLLNMMPDSLQSVGSFEFGEFISADQVRINPETGEEIHPAIELGAGKTLARQMYDWLVTLKLTKATSIESEIDPLTGKVQARFISTTAGSEERFFPRVWMLRMPIYRNGEPVSIPFELRVESQKLGEDNARAVFVLSALGWATVKRDAFLKMLSHVQETLGAKLTVYYTDPEKRSSWLRMENETLQITKMQ